MVKGVGEMSFRIQRFCEEDFFFFSSKKDSGFSIFDTMVTITHQILHVNVIFFFFLFVF